MAKDLFDSFCSYVDSTIFSEENMGGVVAFVVDQTYIDRFCHQFNVKEAVLMNEIKSRVWTYNPTDKQIKGFLAIQLFAASKRANSGGVTTRNYRNRLVQVLDWDIDSLQDWMSSYQDNYWHKLYSWCDRKGFIIAKSYPKFGAGRYVQYPIQQAERVFTEEDLLNIALYFYEVGLRPGEDIEETSFWKIINKNHLSRYARTSHARHILWSSDYQKDGYTQIYNYYLRWDGKYIDNSYKSKSSPTDNIYDLYLSGDFTKIDIRDADFKKVAFLDIEKLKISEIKKYYHFKREGFILFKQNDIYEGYWEEARYLEESENGIAIRFKKVGYRRFVYGKPIYQNEDIEIYSVTPDKANDELYRAHRFYNLEGGLKVARRKYIVGAPPLLRIEQKSKFWIDGTLNQMDSDSAEYILPLDIGHHYIKFQNHPRLEFDIVDAIPHRHSWKDSYNKWSIDRKDNLWVSTKTEEGFVGLNLPISGEASSVKGHVLSDWAMLQTFDKKSNSRNIVLSMLNNNR